MSWLLRIDMDAEDVGRQRILDSYDWHQRLWECFPGLSEASRSFLTRIDLLEGVVRAWLLSAQKPSKPLWCHEEAFALREIAPGFLSHLHYAFDLRVNPTKALVQRNTDGTPKLKSNGKRASGKRVPLVDPVDLRAWIERKGSESGFRIADAKLLEIGPSVGYHFRKKEHAGVHGGVQFRGILEVTDPVAFSRAHAKGIGSAKAFGFGLLLLSPVQL